ncbi:MAG TPA: DUF4012 domain-containing protein [Candidatus Saccharimonadales bacterium]|nr:DUF4012 domain-containing protein [Candidatus Saccharimonadales bacterium]
MAKEKKIINYRKIFLTIFGIFLLFFVTITSVFFILFHQFVPLVPMAPEMLGMKGQRTYLILFQNNMELRPGGGFIGSYGIVSFNKGQMSPLTIHNVYDADGLLHKHIEPYFIGRRYLQVHLYMRDSNFDVDFVKSAQKVAFMLQQETGQKVDGVIAIDLSFVKSLIQVISPVYVWQYNDTVNAGNFFLLTETHADKHSFYGSTQKQDFLRALFASIQAKIQTNKLSYAIPFIQKLADGIQQKHVLFALNDPKLQPILTENKFSSALWDPRKQTPGTINDFLGINEANIGVNKANYFLKRSITHQVGINTQGVIKEKLDITYTNTTQAEKWPSGTYKNYLRVILPLHTVLQSITIDNKTQNIIPAVTDFRKYEAPGFHPPQGLEVDTAEEAGKTIYGFIVPVGLKTTKIVSITYTLPQTVILKNLSLYDLYVFKQPGMDNDPYILTFNPPQGYQTNICTPVTIPLSTDLDIQRKITKL